MSNRNPCCTRSLLAPCIFLTVLAGCSWLSAVGFESHGAECGKPCPMSLGGRWVRLQRRAASAGDTGAVLDADGHAQLERLHREDAELRLDRELLKKIRGLLRLLAQPVESLPGDRHQQSLLLSRVRRARPTEARVGVSRLAKGKLTRLQTQRRRKSTATRTGSAVYAPQPRSAERTETLRISGSRRRIPTRPAASARRSYERSAIHFRNTLGHTPVLKTDERPHP
jgi:hypothetical protein